MEGGAGPSSFKNASRVGTARMAMRKSPATWRAWGAVQSRQKDKRMVPLATSCPRPARGSDAPSRTIQLWYLLSVSVYAVVAASDTVPWELQTCGSRGGRACHRSTRAPEETRRVPLCPSRTSVRRRCTNCSARLSHSRASVADPLFVVVCVSISSCNMSCNVDVPGRKAMELIRGTRAGQEEEHQGRRRG